MGLEVAALMVVALHGALLARDRLELDHGEIATALEVAVLVEDVGDAARHAGGEIAPGGADDDDDAAGHIFAAMVAGAFDHGGGAGIAHGEALAGNAAEIALAGNGAVKHGIADDDRLLRHDAGIVGRPDDDAAAGQALADIVVALAFEVQGHAMGEPGAEALAGGALEFHPDGVLGQAGMAMRLGDGARQHGAGGAVGVADRKLDLDRLLLLDGRGGALDQIAIQHLVEVMVLRLAIVGGDAPSALPACGRCG